MTSKKTKPSKMSAVSALEELCYELHSGDDPIKISGVATTPSELLASGECSGMATTEIRMEYFARRGVAKRGTLSGLLTDRRALVTLLGEDGAADDSASPERGTRKKVVATPPPDFIWVRVSRSVSLMEFIDGVEIVSQGAWSYDEFSTVVKAAIHGAPFFVQERHKDFIVVSGVESAADHLDLRLSNKIVDTQPTPHVWLTPSDGDDSPIGVSVIDGAFYSADLERGITASTAEDLFWALLEPAEPSSEPWFEVNDFRKLTNIFAIAFSGKDLDLVAAGAHLASHSTSAKLKKDALLALKNLTEDELHKCGIIQRDIDGAKLKVAGFPHSVRFRGDNVRIGCRTFNRRHLAVQIGLLLDMGAPRKHESFVVAAEEAFCE